MIVHLQQYKHEEVQFDDNRTTGQSQTEDSLDKDSEEYFGEDVDEFDVATWETIEHDGEPAQRRDVTIDGVTALSVPQQPTEEDDTDLSGRTKDSDLPGRTIQVRKDGGIEHFEQAVIVEVQDDTPQ